MYTLIWIHLATYLLFLLGSPWTFQTYEIEINVWHPLKICSLDILPYFWNGIFLLQDLQVVNLKAFLYSSLSSYPTIIQSAKTWWSKIIPLFLIHKDSSLSSFVLSLPNLGFALNTPVGSGMLLKHQLNHTISIIEVFCVFLIGHKHNASWHRLCFEGVS